MMLPGRLGMSAATSARRPTTPVEPLGVPRNWLAVSPVVALRVIVPLATSGEAATVSQEALVLRPTEVIPTPLPLGTAQVPSAFKNMPAAALPAPGAGTAPLVPPAPASPSMVTYCVETAVPEMSAKDGCATLKVPLGAS